MWSREAGYSQLIWSQNQDVFGPGDLCSRSATSSGPKTVYTPPNYVPPAKDQRINDAVAEAQAAKQRLDDASKRLNDRLAEDNTLAEQLQEARNQNQALQDKLNAAMATPQHTPNQTKTDAEKAAEGDASALQIWGQQVSNNQQ